MDATKMAKALVALALLAHSWVGIQGIVRAQGPGETPKVEIAARVLYASRDAVQKSGLDWSLSPADPASPGINVGSLRSVDDLDETLSALERRGQARVLASPRLQVPNNTEGEIMHGVQIPTQTITNNTVTVTWKDVGLHLKVRPEITAAKLLNMHVRVENAGLEVGPSSYTVKVADGTTIVIGGVPLEGARAAGREVLLFLTPRIVQ